MPKRISPGQLELWNAPPHDSIAERSDVATQHPSGSAATASFRLESATADATTDKITAQRLLNRSFAEKRPLSLLVADDNEVNRKVICLILGKMGYDCAEATNGQEALQLQSESEFDYIFMDLDMPEMDGIEATKLIREREAGSKTPTEIIAVTANVSDETRLKCRRAGMNGYLEKPITTALIHDQILRSWNRIRPRKLAR